MEEKDNLHYEHCMIETILCKMINVIKEAGLPPDIEKEYIEQAFEDFLARVREYKGCPAFKTMTVEQLKKEYEKIVEPSQEQEL